MKLRNKFYTYPVITENSEFYTNSSFSSEVEQILEGYNIKLNLKFKLNNEELEKMLKNEDVIVVHHIECLQTCFRKLISTNNNSEMYILKNGDVNGLVQVCTFLVANKDLKKYSNNLFSQEIRGFKFNIDRGCILAVGNQYDLRIDKIKDDLSNTSSIFSIIQSKDQNLIDVKVDINGDKIVIILPKETYSYYSIISNNIDLQPLMHSILIIPSLVYVLNEIKISRLNLYDFEEYRWYRSLKKVSEKMGVIFDEKGLESVDTFELAQKLLDGPISKAIDYLGGNDDE